MSGGGAGRESVWDGPRPPRIGPSARRVRLELGGVTVAEWKGSARHQTVRAGDREAPMAAWSSPGPVPAFAAIAGRVAFSPAPTECHLDDERVRAREGGISGGWVTDEIVGPFRGGPGTGGW